MLHGLLDGLGFTIKQDIISDLTHDPLGSLAAIP